MRSIILRVLMNIAALWLAAAIVRGVSLDTSHPLGVIFVGIIFGLVNAWIRPIARLLSLPLIVVSLGLFTLVINAALFGLTAWLTPALTVQSFWAALWGSLITALISWALSLLIDDPA